MPRFQDEAREFEPIFRKMCEFVGENYDKFDFDREEWFMDNQWTIHREYLFSEWMINYIYKAPAKIRKKITGFNRPTKKFIKNKFMLAFLLQYGWAYKKGGVGDDG